MDGEVGAKRIAFDLEKVEKSRRGEILSGFFSGRGLCFLKEKVVC